MKWLSYILIFTLGTLLGSALPGYSLQYQQRLQSKLEQVRIDLEPFQDIANRFHEGSLTALIGHHLKSDDSTFYAEGLAIRRMAQSENELVSANAALNGSPLSRAIYFIEEADYETAKGTWKDYRPSILLTADSMKFSLAVGIALCLLSYTFWRIIRLLLKWGYSAAGWGWFISSSRSGILSNSHAGRKKPGNWTRWGIAALPAGLIAGFVIGIFFGNATIGVAIGAALGFGAATSLFAAAVAFGNSDAAD
jgi:hypothetical protein